MRLLKKLQLFLRPAKVTTDRMQELEEMSVVLSEAPGIEEVLEQVLVDVNGEGDAAHKTGREGITAEQIVKLGLLRKRHNLSYRELSTATCDSMSMREFLNLAPGVGLSKSAIHSNLKRVTDATWEQASKCLVQYGVAKSYESGKVVRGDTTAVETNIHHPTDASLLNDSVRVLARTMDSAQKILGRETVSYIDHRRRVKAKLFKINNARGEQQRHAHYLELIRVARDTVKMAEGVVPILKDIKVEVSLDEAVTLHNVRSCLEATIALAHKVIEQAYRRIVKKESVPASEKIVSIFEPHTDIIVKGSRDTIFGHKTMLTTGASGMVLTLKVLEGNPKDSSLLPETLKELNSLFGAAPEMLGLDGCFASKKNRDLAKEAGVKELTFGKNGSLDLSTLVSSSTIHRALKNFRAGIEGCISFLKRIFCFDRVLDRSKETFHAALHMSGFAYNLTLLARMNLAAKAIG